MIELPLAVQSALAADTRQITPLVEMYINGEDESPILLGPEELISLDLYAEAATSVDKPIGNLASQMLSLCLENSSSIFTLTNEESPYYGKMLPEIKLVVYFEVALSEGVSYPIPMGTFYVDTWAADANALCATIEAYDRLYLLNKKEVPNISVMPHITTKKLIKQVLIAAGVPEGEILIDDTLSDTLPWGYLPNDTMGNVLACICESCGVLITVNRNNQIVVKRQLGLTTCDVVLDDDSQIISFANVPANNNLYARVNMHYNLASMTTEGEVVLQLDDILLSPGVTELKGLRVDSGPMIYITAIEVLGGQAVVLEDYDLGAFAIDVTLNNRTSAYAKVTLKVYAVVLSTTQSTISKTNDVLLDRMPDRELSVNCEMIKELPHLHEYMDFLLNLGANPAPLVEFSLRGNPAIELTDIISVQVTSANYTGNIIPLKIEYTCQDGLSCKIMGVDASTREVQSYYYVGFGMITK